MFPENVQFSRHMHRKSVYAFVLTPEGYTKFDV